MRRGRWRPGSGPQGKRVHFHPEGTPGLPATPGGPPYGSCVRALGFLHPGTLPGQEGLEGQAHGEVGTTGTYCLQDARLVQLLCHVSHIKEARKLWPWNRGSEKLWGVRGSC